ncbi:MAG: serine/threonine-protein kinase [Steroidobacteraceae bacterium]
MSLRIHIVTADTQYGEWLRRHIEILHGEAQVQRHGPDTDALALAQQLVAGAAPGDHTILVTAWDGEARVLALNGGFNQGTARTELAPALLADWLQQAEASFSSLVPVRASRSAALELTEATLSRTIEAAASQAGDIPQYSILRLLGESSRSAVYLAHSHMLGRNVALKLSHAQLDDNAPESALEREYAVLSAMDHPAIVRLHDYGIQDGREYLAMEYFPCGDLKARLRHPLTQMEALRYTRRILETLQVVHARGMVHRDLKPPNVMLRADGTVVLIDFGIAKEVGINTNQTAVGILRGSPYYMSPEQTEGKQLDARSDLYSLGVMLFEMLTGQRPYQGVSALEVMHKHTQGRRPALPESQSRLEPLLTKLMAVDREQRYATAAEAADELRTLEERLANDPDALRIVEELRDAG